jgi:hypothetical protein
MHIATNYHSSVPISVSVLPIACFALQQTAVSSGSLLAQAAIAGGCHFGQQTVLLAL